MNVPIGIHHFFEIATIVPSNSGTMCAFPFPIWPKIAYLDVWVLAVFGLFGYALRKLRVDPSPLVVALVLGPMMEKTLRQALFISRGNLVEMLARPLTITILMVPVASFVGPPLLLAWRRFAATGRLPPSAGLSRDYARVVRA